MNAAWGNPGKPEAAASILRPLAKDANALVLVHWALMRAERAAGKLDTALEQAHWLAGNRGRAFVENAGLGLVGNLNIAANNEALLDGAEIAAENGDEVESRRQLQRFTAAWPTASLPPDMRRRVEKLQ